MAFEEVSWITCAVVPATKFAKFKFKVSSVLPERTLLITMTVSAPSDARNAANAERLSGAGAIAETLVSPNADPLPSLRRV